MPDYKLPFVQSSFRSGMYDRPSLLLPPNYCQNIENMIVDRDTLKSRGGLAAFANGYSYPGEIQGIHQFWDNTGDTALVVVSEGRVFRYDFDGANPTELTAPTLSTSADARYVFRNYDGGCYFTDGVNPMCYIPSLTANVALFSTLGPDVPGRASAFEVFENSFWWGNFKDWDADATERQYGTIHSVITRPEEYRADQGARNDHDRQMQVQALLKHGGDLLILQERGIRYATMDPAPGSIGSARTSYFYKGVTEEFENRGLVAPLGAAQSRRGTFIVDRPGIHQIPPGNPPQKPQYVSLPIETFWRTVNQNRLKYAVAARIPEQNGILVCVTVGNSAAQNNRAVFFNVEAWTDRGGDIEDVHPAFSIFKGPDSRAFSFNALATIVDPEGTPAYRQRCIGGDYNGKLFYIDQGATDVGTDIVCKWKGPRFGNPMREIHWDEYLLEISLEATKTIQVTQHNYNRAMTDYTQVGQAPAASTPLGLFMLGTDTLGGATMGTLSFPMVEESRYVEMEHTVLAGSVPITVHQSTIKGSPGMAGTGT